MYPLISLSPNTEPDDIWLAAITLFTPWSWHSADSIYPAEQALSKLFRGRPSVLTASGRSALYHSLKAAGIGGGDEVIIQAFTCIAVPGAISWTGARPIYADIEAGTFNLDPAQVENKLTPRTKAILVQHTFGIPGRLTALSALAKKHHLLLIEDCAHAIGSTYHGQPIGTFGDITILSFGRDKAVSSVYGGAVLTPDVALHARLKLQVADLSPPSPWWTCQQLLHPLLMALVKKTYYLFSLGKLILVLLQKANLLSKAVLPGEKSSLPPPHVNFSPSPALAILLNKQLEKLSLFNQRRRDIARWYDRELSLSLVRPTSPPSADPAWLRYPLLVKRPAELIKKAKQQKIMLGDWYDSPLAPRGSDPAKFFYQLGSCPNAEAAARQIINLPLYPTMSVGEIKKVIAFINQNLQP